MGFASQDVDGNYILIFRNFIPPHALMDLGFSGSPLTWANKKIGIYKIQYLPG